MEFQDLLYRFRWQISFFLMGLILIGAALSYYNGVFESPSKIEVIGQEDTLSQDTKIMIEVSGAVNAPGVYEFYEGARINEALDTAGGLSDQADKDWVERTINRAAYLVDGQKIYIPNQSDDMSAKNIEGNTAVLSDSAETRNKYVNINSASQSELEALWGIGPVYAKNIIEQRPYSSVEELLNKKIIKQNVYDRNKDVMTVY